ncbi:MAG TPA: hypothetical protein PLP27_08290 [Crocinitomicaceae bacterium]|nr:hypothetical protein [Crocinitomicaceae bacterium]
MARTDIMLDDNEDLIISNGDFMIDDSNDQHVAIIFDCVKGEIRQNPSLGFAAMHFLKSNVKDVDLKRALRVELNKDGYDDADIILNRERGVITINVE